MCNFVLRGILLLTFSHDAVRILASPESIAGGAPNCKTGELSAVKFCGQWRKITRVLSVVQLAVQLHSTEELKYAGHLPRQRNPSPHSDFCSCIARVQKTWQVTRKERSMDTTAKILELWF